jgi:hypothetical protein
MEERIKALELGLIEIREKIARMETRHQEHVLEQTKTLVAMQTQVLKVDGRLDGISDKVSNLTGYLGGAALILGLIEPAVVAALMKLFNL